MSTTPKKTATKKVASKKPAAKQEVIDKKVTISVVPELKIRLAWRPWDIIGALVLVASFLQGVFILGTWLWHLVVTLF